MNKLVTYSLLFVLFSCRNECDMLVKNVMIVNVLDGRIEGPKNIYIDSGRIVRIAHIEDEKLKPRKVLDGSGKYIMPGMIDMHAHLPDTLEEDFNMDDYFKLQLSGGVTSIRAMRGRDSYLSLRDSVNRGHGIAPRLFLASPPIYNLQDSLDLDQLKHTLSAQKKNGYSFIKLLYLKDTSKLNNLSIFISDSLLMDFVGHAPMDDLIAAVRYGMRTIEHIEPFVNQYYNDRSKFEFLATQMREKEIFLCPTLFWYYPAMGAMTLDQLKLLHGIDFVKDNVKSAWQQKRANFFAKQSLNSASWKVQLGYVQDDLKMVQFVLLRMHELKVPLLVSPGSGEYCIPGFGMYNELKLLSEAGITNADLLKMATYNAAKALRMGHELGVIEEGARADLLVLNANPIDDLSALSAIDFIVLRGQLLGKELFFSSTLNDKKN